MDVNRSSNTTSQEILLSQNSNNPTKEQFRCMLMDASRDVRKLRKTNGVEASIFVVAEDNLYFVNGQRHFRDMQVFVTDMNVSNDGGDGSENQIGLDENESVWWTRPVETMGKSELESFRRRLSELRNDVDRAIAAKSGGIGSGGDLPSALFVAMQGASFEATHIPFAVEGGGVTVEGRAGGSTASVSCSCGSGLGRARMRGA